MTAALADDQYEVGLQLFQTGNYLLAARALRETIAIEPRHHLAHAILALSLHNLNRPREALGAADAALAIHPGVDALRARALAKLELGDLGSAVATAEDAVKLMPSSAWAAQTLARVMEKSKRVTEAEMQYKRSAGLAPDNMALRAEYGRFLLRRRRLKDAEAVAATIAVHIDLTLVLLLRGEIALRRGRLNEARELALWILSRDAQHHQAIILLTLATANRNPFLKLWWRHAQIISFRPMWQRILWIGLVVAAGTSRGGAAPSILHLSSARSEAR